MASIHTSIHGIPIAMSEVSISSSSSSSVESEPSAADDIGLANYARAMREAVTRLKRVFRDRDKSETLRVAAHERLGEVLRALRLILEKYPKVQTTELLVSASNLIQRVKCYDYEDDTDASAFIESVDRLSVAFNSSMNTRGATFGVALTELSNSAVPPIVTKCVEEIDRRGTTIKGIYRVSGVKSSVEKLCQCFESGHDLVDLSSTPPNVIANVLKLFLRQLPEPLLPYRLYPEFIHVAKSYPSDPHETSDEEELEIVSELRRVVSRMPKVHYVTLSYLMHHLKRITKMSHENNMPSSNLGIVFGPTLLRTSDGDASLSSLLDTVHQSRLVQLLITYSTEIFGADPNEAISDSELVIENSPIQSKVFKSATCVTISGQKVVTGAFNKQTIVEARRQFFSTPCTSPQYRPPTLSMAPILTTSSTISPFSQSITSSLTTHPKLRRTASSQQSQPITTITPSGNELSRSATAHALAFNRNNETRQLKYL